MDVRVGAAIDLAAGRATVATVERRTSGQVASRRVAIERLGQRAGDRFEVFQAGAKEEVGVAQTTAFKTPLQEIDRLTMFWEVGE